MYLKSLYELGRTQDPVPVTALAERLGITTVSASEMVRRLQERKLVQHKPYKGARLTPDGELRAIAVLRRHRLWERFLTDRLGMGWVEAHDAACHLEHAANEQVVDALDSFLEFPDTCPHGNPIHRSGVERTRAEEHPLNRLKIGDHAKVLRVRDEGVALLAYLEGQGLKPGQEVELVGIAPFDGPRTLRLDGREAVIGREAAEHVMVAMEGPRA